jgi:hypothetical protein
MLLHRKTPFVADGPPTYVDLAVEKESPISPRPHLRRFLFFCESIDEKKPCHNYSSIAEK